MAEKTMSIETAKASPDHFETHHVDDETMLCMQHNGQCSVLVEVDGSAEQQIILESAVKKGLEKLDAVFEGRFAELFAGLQIKFGEYPGGGEAHQAEGLITFDAERMSMSLADAEAYLVDQGQLNPGDWTRTMSPEEAMEPGSCLVYNLVHEAGHLIDDTNPDGSLVGIDTRLSPTKYGSMKPNEAAAEAFTYKVFSVEIQPNAETEITNRIEKKKGRSNG